MNQKRKLFRIASYRFDIKSFSTKTQKKDKKKYTHTVQLPKTQFPQWMNFSKRIELDEYILKNCGFNELYLWQRQNLDSTEFVLHDGPPYANGLPHMGHAINKILKDIINRSKVLSRTKVNYIPGWDCHGLPIELKALKGETGLGPLEIRERARKFAKLAINDQRSIFKTWGLMADWEKNCYYTFDREYVKNQLQQFFKLYEKKLIYRDMKPVYWSPSSRTALAEAELEYKDHQSEAVTVRLKLVEGSLASAYKNLYLLVWTTTPWSLPANEAVAFNPSFDYSIVEVNGEHYVICSKLIPNLQNKLNSEMKELKKIKGDALSDCKYLHPLRQSIMPILPALYVTDDVGTGLVHTAPSHGPDDYLLALQHQLPIVSYVDEAGNYTKEAGENLDKLFVLNEGMQKVIDLLQRDILNKEKIIHSYPYDWRTKKPIILRASKQWFIDTKAVKSSAIDILEDIKIIPERNVAGLITQIESRPYWCISRQRAWGVPIPVIYDQQDNIVISKELIDHYCKLIDKEGTDFWWSCSISDMIPEQVFKHLGVEGSQIKKGEDILDIWFDSGLSWSAVLNQKVADLYLEGIDQFTGWFQSSLLTSVALCNQAPYRTILAHGFAVDDEGKKMSKSIGNVVDPQDIIYGNPNKKIQPLGVDVLRWWVAGHSLQHTNIPVSKAALEDSVNAIKKIRNSMKFLLGSIHDLPPKVQPELFIIDRYILLKTAELTRKVTAMFNAYEFNKICMLILNFVSNDLSSFYCTITKDRLYCDEAESNRRRAVQFTMNEVLHSVLRMIGPIVPVLTEEVFLHHPHNIDKLFYFHGNWKPCPKLDDDLFVTSVMEKALILKEVFLKEKPVNIDTSKIVCTIESSEEFWNKLNPLQDVETSSNSELVELLQCAEVTLLKSNLPCDFTVTVKSSRDYLCDRCRRYTSKEEGGPCLRCLSVLRNFS